MKEKDMQTVEEILGKLETADNTTKNKIENILVDKGTAVVPELVNQLQTVRAIFRDFQVDVFCFWSTK